MGPRREIAAMENLVILEMCKDPHRDNVGLVTVGSGELIVDIPRVCQLTNELVIELVCETFVFKSINRLVLHSLKALNVGWRVGLLAATTLVEDIVVFVESLSQTKFQSDVGIPICDVKQRVVALDDAAPYPLKDVSGPNGAVGVVELKRHPLQGVPERPKPCDWGIGTRHENRRVFERSLSHYPSHQAA